MSFTMGVRSYASVTAFLDVAQAASTRGEFTDLLWGIGIVDAAGFDSEIFGGRYFAAGVGDQEWVVLEAQPSGTVDVVSPRMMTLEAARERASWLAQGPHPAGLSVAARERLNELAAAGSDGIRMPTRECPEHAAFMQTLRDLRRAGFTIDQHLRRREFKLHTPWAGRDGVWPANWHTIRGLDVDFTIAIAEGFSREQAREYLDDMADTDGRSALATVTVETAAGRVSAEQFLMATV